MANRISRNIEMSLADRITTDLTASGWQGIGVVKSFKEVKGGTTPVICINVLELRPKLKEIGSKVHLKYFTINIRIFASSDGQRLDLSDWLFEKLEDDTIYYTYTMSGSTPVKGAAAGRICIENWFDNRKELTNTENLAEEDRYRHLLSFEVRVTS